jgi:uncharacterized protein (TIGR03032 family)
MHHPPSRPHRASRRVPPVLALPESPERRIAPSIPTADFGIEASPRLRQWLQARRISLALSTGSGDRIVTLGVAESGLVTRDAICARPTALLQTAKGLYVAAETRLWRFDDALGEGESFQGADRLFLPSQSRPTGAIGIEDLAAEESGKLLAAVSRFNCIARMNSRGDLKPIWRPAFIDAIVSEDRCHVSGFCLSENALAYVAVAAASNERDGWRKAERAAGQVIEAATHRVVAEGLALPRAPRLYRNRLWILESGTGWFGWIDCEQRRFERVTQLPGAPHGLRFLGDHAVIAIAGETPGLCWVNVKSGAIEHRLSLTGAIDAVTDLAVIPGGAVPKLAGLVHTEAGQGGERVARSA